MLHYRRFRRWSMLLTAGFLIGLASAGLAACGYNGSIRSGAPVTQQSSASATRQSSTSVTRPQTQGTQPPQQGEAQAQQCGVVFASGTLLTVPRDETSIQVEDCFWLAFQHCRPATLVFTTSGIAKGTAGEAFTRTFTIHSANGACTISDMLQKGLFPHALLLVATSTCTGLRREPNALEFLSCGQDGTVSVLGA